MAHIGWAFGPEFFSIPGGPLEFKPRPAGIILYDEVTGTALLLTIISMTLDLWAPRGILGIAPFYETWFLKLNDPANRNALWVRYSLVQRLGGAEATGWFVLFDAQREEVFQRRYNFKETELALSAADPLYRAGANILERRRARGGWEGVEWDVRCEREVVPGGELIPPILGRLGIASSMYAAVIGGGTFQGEASCDGRRYVFTQAAGSAGHLWGRRMGRQWRWAHATFQDPSGDWVGFEILSAQGRLGPASTPVVTSARLWKGGRLHVSLGLWAGLRNKTFSRPGGWSFRVHFDGFIAEGDCASREESTARLEYEGPRGESLVCRSSMLGACRLSLTDRSGAGIAEYRTQDSAAVEEAR
ncbi:MAG: hypothetical protein HY551_03525 [Elusimicrobia bacterium]|nr:hypothetical protein [Elusimicrobiota bacterium]